MTIRVFIYLSVAVLLVSAIHSPAAAGSRGAAGEPVVLVASRRGVDSVGEVVVLAVPLGNGGHFGFLLNQPTQTLLTDLFPTEEASSRVRDPVHVGGPFLPNTVFAVVREADASVSPLRRVTPQLSIALQSAEVDSVITERAKHARFFMGMQLWMPGQLQEEIEAGAWTLCSADVDTVLARKPERLWTRLSDRDGHRALADQASPRPAILVGRHLPAPDPAAFPRGFRLRHG